MTEQHQTDIHRQLSRREFLRSAGLGAVGLASLTIVGCGTGEQDNEGTSGTAAATTLAPTTTLQTLTLHHAEHSAFNPEINAQEFQRVSGIPTESTVITFVGLVPEWVQGGYTRWDTIAPQGAQMAPLIEAGTLQVVRDSELEHWDKALPVFREPGAAGQDAELNPYSQIYTQEAMDSGRNDEFWVVPTVWNGDTIGYRTDLIDEDLNSYGALWDPKYRGQVGIFNSSLRAPMEVLATVSYDGSYQLEGTIGNPSQADIDYAIDFLIERKREGQFRVLWDDYGQAVELLANGEISLLNAWETIVTEVRSRGFPALYAPVREGYNMWFHGISVSSDTPNREAAIEFINFWHSGFPASKVVNSGYMTPIPDTAEDLLRETESPVEGVDAWEYWYAGGGRDRGSAADIASNGGWWWQFPDESEYLANRWEEFVSA
jgi:spermidine/putrescine-binding protein